MSARVLSVCLIPITLVLGGSAAVAEEPVVPTDVAEFETHIRPFLDRHCVACHGADKQKADFAVHDLDGEITSGKDLVRWEKVLELVSLGDMPPEEEPQPTKLERSRVTTWVRAELKKVGRGLNEDKLRLPSQANRLDHAALFSGEHRGPSYSPSRLWRISPQIYQRFSSEMRTQVSQPLLGLGAKGIQDYASLLADESTIKTMLRNSNLIASTLLEADRARLGYVLSEDGGDEDERIERGIRDLFRIIFQRDPTEEDRARYVEGLFRENYELGGARIGFRTLVVAMLMSPEFVFRMEVGLGEELPDGRRMLSPEELAYALSFAFFDRPDETLLRAAREGRLATRADVEREVRRILDTEDKDKRYWHYPMYHRWGQDYYEHRPRVLRFFQEFFGYPGAVDVFKDHERNPEHHALRLRKDADLLVLSILEKDRRVLEELLTTSHYPMDYFKDDKLGKLLAGGGNQRQLEHLQRVYGDEFEAIAEAGKWPGIDSRHVGAYNIDLDQARALRRDPGQPVALPPSQRAGMLTHPAWLVAHSGNFENDPIRRGKWIRERLLADLVPEVPIGVDAKVPEDPHRTLRERMEVVRKEECWRCHKHMDPLGLPFESYDDFGRFRDRIVIGDADAYFKEERRYEEQVRRTREDLEKWRKLDSGGRAIKVREAEEQLAGLVEPPPGTENYPAALRRYENDLKRWTGERQKWDEMTDDDQRREIARLEEHLRTLVPPVADSKPVEAGGVLNGTGDPQLDGPVEDAIDLVHRLARSERVRQSFVRHVFRYWMGRNETLDDSPSLMAADAAYVASDGSFKELLVSLLTSDSFLYRR